MSVNLDKNVIDIKMTERLALWKEKVKVRFTGRIKGGAELYFFLTILYTSDGPKF